MKTRDQRLGMARDILRRDFLGGLSVALGASLLPLSAPAALTLRGTSRASRLTAGHMATPTRWIAARAM